MFKIAKKGIAIELMTPNLSLNLIILRNHFPHQLIKTIKLMIIHFFNSFKVEIEQLKKRKKKTSNLSLNQIDKTMLKIILKIWEKTNETKKNQRQIVMIFREDNIKGRGKGNQIGNLTGKKLDNLT